MDVRGTHEYQKFDGSEGSSENEGETLNAWWVGQFSYLVTGIVSGIVASMLGRIWSLSRARVSGVVDQMAKNFNNLSTDNKMVFVIRTDLGMGKGKVAAQCAHAAVFCYKMALKQTPQMLRQWEVFGQTKVTLKIDNVEEMKKLESKAKSMGVVAGIVRDAGRTQIEAGTETVLGIGPAPTSQVDQITGHLKLY